MKNILKYYYNLEEVDILNLDNNYLIFDKDDNTYYLYEIDVENINILNNLNNKYHKIIFNKYKKNITKINDKNYVLFYINVIINEEVTLNEIISNNINNRIKNKNISDIVSLWSNKIDYLEYQISELSKDKEEVLNSFSFFIGLAENAISFININNINFNNLTKSITHQRLYPNILNIDYYNPLNVLEDYEIRDYSEYIKAKILKSDDILNDIKLIINDSKLTIDDIKLFYARLLFPTLYFDVLESVILDEKKEKNLEIFIDTLPNYLNMLKDTYLEIKKSISIDIPSWITKN
mgnify:CR=1 FL=1